MSTPAKNNPFRHFWDLGWRRLLPIIPADATLPSGADPGNTLGKAPGNRLGNGTWVGLTGWTSLKATEADLDLWHSWGSNVGMALTELDLVFDIDLTDKPWSDLSEKIITDMAGESPCRIGMEPKRMLFYRLSAPVRGGAIYATTAMGDEKIELFTHGRQVALYGMHRKANAKMKWPRLPVPYDELPVITPEQYDAICAALVAALPEGSRTKDFTGADRSAVPQETLRGDPALIKKAMASLPNNRNIYPSYDDYIRMGAALKASMDDEGEAFDLWCEWCEKDSGGTPGMWEKHWASLKGGFAIGAGWIYDQAEKFGDGSFSLAEVHFEPVAESEPSPFEVRAKAEAQEADDDLFPVLSLRDIESRPPPRFLVDRHIPQVSTGFLYSAPGAGKSFLALDLALSLAFKKPDWHGDALDPGDDTPSVLYIAAEGSFGFRNRVRAWRTARNIPHDAPDTFVMIERTIDFMRPDDVAKLIRTVRKAVQRRPCLVVVDTVSRSMPGADENLQKEMTLFVKACDHVKDAFQCAVLGVHHAGKSGDMRGSTVLRGAGDFVFKLERAKGASVGHLSCEKQKDAPDGWTEPYLFEKLSLGDGQTSLVASRAAMPGGREGPMTPTSASLVLAAMRAAWEAGEPWGKTRRAGALFAVDRMVRDHGLSAEQAESYLGLWLADGTVVLEEVSRKTKRVGYRVLREGVVMDAATHFTPVKDEAYDGHTDGGNVFE